MADKCRSRIDLAVINQMLSNNKLHSFTWVPDEKQLVDCLTKQSANPLNLTQIFEKAFMDLKYTDCLTTSLS